MNFRICGIGLAGVMLAGLALPTWAETSRSNPSPTGSPQAVAPDLASPIANEVPINHSRNVTVDRADPPPYGAGYKQRLQWWLQANQLPKAAAPSAGGESTSNSAAGATEGNKGNSGGGSARSNGNAGTGNSGNSGSAGSRSGR